MANLTTSTSLCASHLEHVSSSPVIGPSARRRAVAGVGWEPDLAPVASAARGRARGGCCAAIAGVRDGFLPLPAVVSVVENSARRPGVSRFSERRGPPS